MIKKLTVVFTMLMLSSFLFGSCNSCGDCYNELIGCWGDPNCRPSDIEAIRGDIEIYCNPMV